MTDIQSISFQKDLAVYRLLGAVRAFTGMMLGRMTAEDRIAGIVQALADCEREREALDAKRAASDVQGAFA